ncbi:MAG: formylglycine-generating enzyme family protein [Candidatus Kapaibacterium sp.]
MIALINLTFVICHLSLTGMVHIPAGYYRPFYTTKGVDSIRIESFYMDASPVTNKAFLEFVKANPEWVRSAVSLMLAGPGYLKLWKNDFEIGNPVLENMPVVNVSWFAARAYAKWRGKRLPTIAEWEYAALAPIVKPVPASGNAKKALVLEWYSKQNSRQLQQTCTLNQNADGVCDLFGQVWEWVEDFNSVILPGESGSNLGALCGAAAAGSLDPTDYATFMRFAMRNSLKANDVTDQLGFRCVK